MANPFTVLSLIACTIYLTLIFFVWNKKIRRQLKVAIILMYTSLAIWSGAYAFVYPASMITRPAELWLWFNLSAFGWCTFPSTTLHFVLALTNCRRLLHCWWIYLVIYLAAAVKLWINFWGPGTALGFRAVGRYIIEIPNREGWMAFHLAYNLVFFFAIFIILVIWAVKTTSRNERMQGIVTAGVIALSTIIALVSNLILPSLHTTLPAMGQIFALLLACGFLYSIFKHRMLNLTPAIASESILGYINDMVLLTDSQRQLIFINQQVTELLGCQPEDLADMRLEALGEDPLLISTCMDRDDPAEACPELYTSLKTRSGDLVYCRLRISAVREADELVGYVAVAQDMRPTLQLEHEILEKTRAEAALRESETRYREIFNNASDLIYINDLEGRLLAVNPAALLVTGYCLEEALNMNLLDLVVPEDKNRVREILASQLEDGQVNWYEIGVLSKHGKHIDLEISTCQLFRDGVPVAWQGTARDITQRKQIEDRMRYLSLHDAVTGLYNRGFFNEEMDRLSHGRNPSVGMVICDMDGLKLVNDILGHEAGDRQLLEAARLISSCFRSGDVVARLGGDEFGVILPGSTSEQVAGAAKRIRQAVVSYNGAGPQIMMSISVGWAIRDNPDLTMSDLFKIADDRMYAVKASSETQAFKKALAESLRAL